MNRAWTHQDPVHPLAGAQSEPCKPVQSGNGSRLAVPGRHTALFGWSDWIERVYANGSKDHFARRTCLYPHVVDAGNFAHHADHLREVEAIFSTWGMPLLAPEQLAVMPRLKAVFYAGGSVKAFARPLLERDIIVVSAWHANAVPVAEFTLAQILLGAKGYFRNTREYKSPGARETAHRGRGNYGETIAILGAGAIGEKVIKLLGAFDLRVIVYDPYLSDERAAILGVEKVSLEAAFDRAYVVSNHVADCPETAGVLNGALFRRMRPDATFINTGRGQTVCEAEMIAVLQARPDITALLDITHPEPPPEGSPLYTLPNVQLSAHIAGSIGEELIRMANYCMEEFIAWQNGQPLRYAVSLPMLDVMA
jgi:phosphoglycerate dehydrogenase-like enzyme